jgi:regulator of nucleoside diphosphate kinase
MKPDIIISSHDLERLEALLDSLPASMSSNKAALLEELNRADIREPQDIPATVVTMNSKVHFVVEPSREEFSLTLSYPANVADGPERISVLSPVGAAILGLSVGAEIDWPGPSGANLRVRVLEVVDQSRPGKEVQDRSAGERAAR